MAKKIRLTPDQKKWHENLEKHLASGWHNIDRDLKEAILDGPFAVLSARNVTWKNFFDCLVCCDSFDAAKVVVKWSCSTACCVLDLRGFEAEIVYEIWRRWSP